MPAYTNTSAIPREELVAVIRQGAGLNKFNIWQELLPAYPVNRRTVHLIKKEIANSDIARILSDKYLSLPGAEVEAITLTYNDDSFTVAIRKRNVKIPDEVELDLKGYLSVEQDASQTGAENLELTNEYLAANACFSTATFGSAQAPIAAYTAANVAAGTIDFFGDCQNMIELVNNQGELVNTIVIPVEVYRYIRRSALAQKFLQSNAGFQGTAGEMITPNVIQKALADEGIEKVLIGRSRYNTAPQGATPAFTLAWNPAYIGFFKSGNAFVADDDGIQTVTGIGASIFWEDYTPNEGYTVETFRHEITESNIVRTKSSLAPYIANSNAGALLATSFA